MNKPRLCFVGPMTGHNPGMVPTQGEFLAKAFTTSGYPVMCVSTRPNRWARLLDIVWTVWRRRTEIDIQVIQVFSGRSFLVSDIASLLGIIFRQRIVMVLRGGALPEFSSRHTGWVKRVLSRADKIVAPSEYLVHTLAWLGFDLQIIPNAVDLSKYTYRQRKKVKPRLLWMRAFHPIYNPFMAIDVFVQLQAEYPSAILTMAGQDLGLLQFIREYACERRVERSISFPGFLDADGKAREFSNNDIFINTNRVDNMPVSVIEAAAFGLPVVSTNVGGMPYLIEHEQTGLLVDDSDAEGMVVAIIRLLNIPDLANRLSQNAKKKAEEFDSHFIFPQWELVINSFVK